MPPKKKLTKQEDALADTQSKPVEKPVAPADIKK